jgi:hypothetical protein
VNLIERENPPWSREAGGREEEKEKYKYKHKYKYKYKYKEKVRFD